MVSGSYSSYKVGVSTMRISVMHQSGMKGFLPLVFTFMIDLQ